MSTDVESSRLNFLFLVTDQHRPDHTGFGGNPMVQTPNLDRIAARGTCFTQAYVANPICMPNRSTMMTGRVPSAHGTRYNGIPLDRSANTFVRVLRSAGYRTALIGKSHLQNMGNQVELALSQLRDDVRGEALPMPYAQGWADWEQLERHKLERVQIPPDFYGFDEVDLVIDHGDLASGHYYQWLLEQGIDPVALQGPRNALQSYDGWDQIYQTALTEDLYPTSYVAMRTCEFLESAAAGALSGARPFFIQSSYPDPHHPFTPPGAYYNLYSPDAIDLPVSFGDEHRDSMPHVQRMIKYRGSQRGKVTPWAVTEEQYRESAAKEYGMISLIDAGVGRILDTLETTGLAESTAIVFTSDHGDMFGDHGLLLKASLHYQGCVRVPLVIDVPGRTASVRDDLVGTIDLAQTILHLAGELEFDGMQGQSLASLVGSANGDGPTRDALLVEEDEMVDMARVGQPLRMRTVVGKAGRLTLYQGAEHGELYDLANDPLEMTNLFAKPEGRDLRFHLTERLARLQTEHDDRGRRPTAMA